MLMLKYVSLMMFISGLMVFSSKRKHLLLMLLSLEMLVLSVFFILFMYLSLINLEYFFCMIFLTFSVCEGALGLSILVSLIRTHGNDYFQTFSVLW
uniref:NADH-ubiquinone oxidoreductase chain 4L n=1 Tax=Hemipeplus sp. HEM01 TaxID=1205628 RepID=A0A0S2MSB0_9CUCU|nr:NADH deshydrogenase subunit 4L [Hemipeplus sp. HEM01]